MPNRLAEATSPYLLQHADNPVEWYQWGEEALQLAQERDVPILLSIGYSACHWCHVMAHESFENPQIAALMNEWFVNIKVDREERPDLDALYMLAVQVMTGQGGWPMTVLLTPDGRPFYGGTYFPPADRGPMPGFPRVLTAIHEAWTTRRADLEGSADRVAGGLRSQFEVNHPPSPVTAGVVNEAASGMATGFDRTSGGWGGAPKFPPSMSLEFLLRVWARDGGGMGAEQALRMAEFTLDHMARGGLYDQVGGGFHRYTVDAVWLVPHFEKMLYDNALLAHIYVLAWQATDDPFYQVIAEETYDWVLREMTSPEGGFYSTLDADTEGHEGRFYAWTPGEVAEVLGDEAAGPVTALLGVTEAGNFEGSNVLSIPQIEDRLRWRSVEFAGQRGLLLNARNQRTRPARDEKVLAAWNGMLLRGLALAARVFDSPRLRDAAVANASFIRAHLIVDGRLARSWKDGVASGSGFLEDYANVIDGLLMTYEATWDPQWVVLARQLADLLLEEFAQEGTLWDSGVSQEVLISRPRDATDNATPSGTSVATDALLRLAALTGEARYSEVATNLLAQYAELTTRHPQAFGRLLCAMDTAVGPSAEVAIIGDPESDETHALLEVLRTTYLPRVVLALSDGPPDDVVAQAVPLLAERTMLDGRATAYVCRNFTCQLPTNSPAAFAEQLRSAMQASE